MKKGFLCVVALLMTLSITACSSIPGMGGSSSGAGSSASGSGAGSSNKDGNFYVGDKVSTIFLDFTVNSVESVSEYEGYTPAEGNKLVVLDMTIKNTETYSLPMFQSDFPLFWGSGDEDGDFPLEKYCDKQLDDEYEIPIGKSTDGVLVYEMPQDAKDCVLVFEEYFEDESVGENYGVYFTVD